MGPAGLTALAALSYGPSPFPREFRRSLLLPSPLRMYHMYCVSLLRELGGCSCTRESGACVRVRVCVHEQARVLPVCGQLKGHQGQAGKASPAGCRL